MPPSNTPTDIVEELFVGEGIGVEVELNSESEEGGIKPWDPDKIRVVTKNFSLRNVLDMIDTNDLELAPDFQRNRVWKSRQKSRLIESLLLQIPLPAFYFAEDSDGLLRVVDGLQRLSTIHSFVRENDFPLHDMEYLSSEEGKSFEHLSQVLQRRLHNAQIVVHVIDPTTPEEVKYDIFKRINTGGEPLNSMEIRHCMSRSRSRDFLRRCCDSPAFNTATGDALLSHIRMQDREAALRFLAFRMISNISQYEEFGTLERLLDWATAQLDNELLVPDSDLELLFNDFESSMEKATIVFGSHAFRKWPLDSSDRLSPINRALFESWAISLAEPSIQYVKKYREFIVEKARYAMTYDQDYLASISSSTGNPGRLRKRFEVADEIVREAGK
ncbi:DUF262 domain-containing protein [Rhodococcus qingshengii]|uniref:DUF262 domain-containing protein n=1 Tax=Rhodococcus qingshengii TaxID=334542 RepID=UPI0022B4F200|nr:DUF262 domain-containing protein [Rhodococcus qingshengii]MCZ4618456.1 DUF262 domain-containing protein [Rhodococcus qingshengii]